MHVLKDGIFIFKDTIRLEMEWKFSSKEMITLL